MDLDLIQYERDMTRAYEQGYRDANLRNVILGAFSGAAMVAAVAILVWVF